MKKRARYSSASLFTHPGKMRTMKVFGFSLSLILINLASIMERADERLLPAVYKEVSEAFNAGPTELGYLTFVMNFVQAVSSPIAGILALQYDRPTVLAMGTIWWAVATAAVGLSKKFHQVLFWRAINGIGLAIVIPPLQSFIADSYSSGSRGAGFGLLNIVGAAGGIGGGVVATVVAGRSVWGVEGWRFVFLVMAGVSLGIGGLVYVFVDDPRRSGESGIERTNLITKDGLPPRSLWRDSVIAMRSVIKVQTFQIIVLQGIVGSLPWTAIVFFTMWFELIGFDNKTSAALNSIFSIGCATGSLIGGLIADKLSKSFPDSTRISCAQFSAFMGIPFSLILLTIIPQSNEYFVLYAFTLLLMGLTISWCASCANNPMFAEVVPLRHRTMIYAFDRAFEGAFSSFAAPAVGLVTERIYGYDSKSVNLEKGSAEGALALSRGLLTMTVIPFGMCVLFYTPLYYVFKRDRESAKIASAKEQELI